jgi:hypothetical protein
MMKHDRVRSAEFSVHRRQSSGSRFKRFWDWDDRCPLFRFDAAQERLRSPRILMLTDDLRHDQGNGLRDILSKRWFGGETARLFMFIKILTHLCSSFR